MPYDSLCQNTADSIQFGSQCHNVELYFPAPIPRVCYPPPPEAFPRVFEAGRTIRAPQFEGGPVVNITLEDDMVEWRFMPRDCNNPFCEGHVMGYELRTT